MNNIRNLRTVLIILGATLVLAGCISTSNMISPGEGSFFDGFSSSSES